MSAPDLEALLAPLDAAAPCGADCEYDPAYLALLEAGAGLAEQQYGETIIPAQGPDWRSVHEHALHLASHTRDLRVAVWLVRAGARQHGLAAAVTGLQLVQGLLERHWPALHPQLDADDHDDPTMRLNALLPLTQADAVLADLRAAALGNERGALTVRDIELALRAAEPRAGEAVPDEARVLEALAKAAQATPALAERLGAGLAAAEGIAAAVHAHVGAKNGPDFAPLVKLLGVLDAARVRATGGPAPAAAAASPGGAAAALPHAEPQSRDDAARALDRICDWLERHEPSHPAPLLIRRARRLMSKSFIDIVRDLVPEGADAVERLAGRTGD